MVQLEVFASCHEGSRFSGGVDTTNRKLPILCSSAYIYDRKRNEMKKSKSLVQKHRHDTSSFFSTHHKIRAVEKRIESIQNSSFGLACIHIQPVAAVVAPKRYSSRFDSMGWAVKTIFPCFLLAKSLCHVETCEANVITCSFELGRVDLQMWHLCGQIKKQID